MKQPLITVLMPVYNAEPHLREAIESVLDQSFRDFKLLIVNDGSTDGSRSTIEEFADDRIEILDLPQNGGLVNALNAGLSTIHTKYIARTDADDICLADRLNKQVDFMENHAEVGALGTGFDSLMSDGSIRPGGRFSPDHGTIRLRHLYQIQIIHGTSMLRTEVLKKHDLKFDPSFKHAEDYDFFDRLGNVSRIANIQEPLYLIRHHKGRVSNQFSEIQKTNSDRVKTRIFAQIGIETSSENLELIQWLMYQNYGWFNHSSCEALANLINKLIEANNSTHYFQPEFLRRELCTRFLHLCSFVTKQEPNAAGLLSTLKYLRFTDGPRLMLAIKTKSFLGRV